MYRAQRVQRVLSLNGYVGGTGNLMAGRGKLKLHETTYQINYTRKFLQVIQ